MVGYFLFSRVWEQFKGTTESSCHETLSENWKCLVNFLPWTFLTVFPDRYRTGTAGERHSWFNPNFLDWRQFLWLKAFFHIRPKKTPARFSWMDPIFPCACYVLHYQSVRDGGNNVHTDTKSELRGRWRVNSQGWKLTYKTFFPCPLTIQNLLRDTAKDLGKASNEFTLLRVSMHEHRNTLVKIEYDKGKRGIHTTSEAYVIYVRNLWNCPQWEWRVVASHRSNVSLPPDNIYKRLIYCNRRATNPGRDASAASPMPKEGGSRLAARLQYSLMDFLCPLGHWVGGEFCAAGAAGNKARTAIDKSDLSDAPFHFYIIVCF